MQDRDVEILRQAEEVIQYLGQQQSQLSLAVVGKTMRQLRDTCERIALRQEKRLDEMQSRVDDLEKSLRSAREAFVNLQKTINSREHAA